MLEISQTDHGGVTVLHAAGRIDSTTARQLEDAVSACIESGRVRLVVDLGATDFLSSAGLRALLGGAKRARGQGGQLTLCAATGGVSEVLDVAGFSALVGSHPGVAQAAAALGG